MGSLAFSFMDDEFYTNGSWRTARGSAPEVAVERKRWPHVRWRAPAFCSSLPFHLLLFLLTLLTTLVVGAHLATNYVQHRPAFDLGLTVSFFSGVLRHPSLLARGVPFSFTLVGILLAHELGHYLTCRHYGVRASYPYFLPAPTLIGTLGAFIRIKSPIFTRRVLFDVGVSGPLAGFALAIPALVFAVVHAQAGAVVVRADSIRFGNPLALTLLVPLLRPGLSASHIILTPVGCAAWVGLFATSLNLLPMGQLDGGHILYAVLGDRHRILSRGAFLALVPLGIFCWAGWGLWAALLLLIGLRHPMVMMPSEPLGRGRKVLAIVAALILVLCFVPTPFSVR